MSTPAFFNLVTLPEVSSTNEVLLRASFAEHPPGTALLALRQTAGRGRADRVWASADGGMYLSVMLAPNSVEGLTLLGALCVLRLCHEQWGMPAVLRWPNDVYLQGRKLSGVLPQVKFHGSKVERAVLGVGLNVKQNPSVFPEEVRSTAVTLAELLPEVAWKVESVATRFLEVLAEEFARFEAEGCAGLARRCEVFLDGTEEGQVVGVSRGGDTRLLARAEGLGSRGELLLADGSRLEQLGMDERLVILGR
ncbi:MAG: biotin--[acetyl-CoA-carboxylase] ligase [Candidatus Eremiobacteraeota bacterium]|nr:biotin--[acetyl-CoA-carboxylase] ligase [Candidatus Eremiobacteraeota bacterium]